MKEGKDVIQINNKCVQKLAYTMNSLSIAKDFAEQVAPRVNASDESKLHAFLWAAAICHSTKGGLKGTLKGSAYKGWDYLLRAFCYAAEDKEAHVSPDFIAVISGDELFNLLTRYAEDREVNLPDIERRAEILNGCAIQLEKMFNKSVVNLLRQASNKVGGDFGAYALLSQLDAFQDPLKKKSTAFLMTVYFSGAWKIIDNENVLPMIDYHRIRVLCRTGCISIQDPGLLRALISQQIVPQAIEESLRQASMKVCKSVVVITGMPMFDFDVLLWAHARSCCRNFPLCVSGQLEHNSFYNYIEKDYTGVCEFQEWCAGFRNRELRAIWEPLVETEHY
ncbi:hypothetical protein FJZ33_00405 [Candidatus Poribacteria bacterium]|nr:hypothetical protein [Candidatus Poribacteria bacterium]